MVAIAESKGGDRGSNSHPENGLGEPTRQSHWKFIRRAEASDHIVDGDMGEAGSVVT